MDSMPTEDILLSLLQGEEKDKSWAKDLKGWIKDHRIYYCYWDGVNCDPVDKTTVVSIFLPENGVKGTLPSELGLLVNLHELSLPDNEIKGTIPQEITDLPHLQIINLSRNELEGSIPRFASPSLKSIDLGHNSFSGTLCNDFGKLHERMTDIDLTGNNITGNIPDSISFMTALDALSLSTNKFSGTIPPSIGFLRGLRYLYLDHNFLMGTIPPTLWRMNSPIAELWLQENSLSGTIPASVADMPELFNFYIDGNKLTGTVPHELCRKELNADFFDGVEESKRDYCDSIACPPGEVSEKGLYPCKKCNDTYFNPYLGRVGKCIDLNQHDILETLYDSTDGDNWNGIDVKWTKKSDYYCAFTGITCDDDQNVIGINLRGKGLKGTIPEEIGFLRYLRELDFSFNHLTGFIPSDLRWAPLEKLDLSGNQLRGIVPSMLCLKEGINGNGDGGHFGCEHIACPPGYYGSFGKGFSTSEDSRCMPCVHGGDFLGSAGCVNHSVSATKNTHNEALGTGGKVVITATVLFCAGFLFYAHKRFQRSKEAVLSDYRPGSRVRPGLEIEEDRVWL